MLLAEQPIRDNCLFNGAIASLLFHKTNLKISDKQNCAPRNSCSPCVFRDVPAKKKDLVGKRKQEAKANIEPFKQRINIESVIFATRREGGSIKTVRPPGPYGTVFLKIVKIGYIRTDGRKDGQKDT